MGLVHWSCGTLHCFTAESSDPRCVYFLVSLNILLYVLFVYFVILKKFNVSIYCLIDYLIYKLQLYINFKGCFLRITRKVSIPDQQRVRCGR